MKRYTIEEVFRVHTPEGRFEFATKALAEEFIKFKKSVRPKSTNSLVDKISQLRN
jgi:hypothetical protein